MGWEGWFWVGLGGELYEGVGGWGHSKGFRPVLEILVSPCPAAEQPHWLRQPLARY
jgi:hypothetical protein